MSMTVAELAALAAKTEDQTETTSTTYERVLIEAGPTMARFIGYIELGMEAQKPYMGKAKPDADMVRLVFELNSKKHMREIEVEGGKKTVPTLYSITVSKKFGEKAAFKKLFNKMLYGRDGIVHLAQMLGQAFLITIVHNSTGEGAEKKTYANMADKDGVWTISAPVITDPIEGSTKQVPVPEAITPLQIFLWDNPTKETWDSLFIDGTYTKKEGDKEVEVSKNWLQNRIKAATNFTGSPLDLMLGGVNLPSTEEAMKKEEAKGEDLPADTGSMAADADFDPMAALGL